MTTWRHARSRIAPIRQSRPGHETRDQPGARWHRRPSYDPDPARPTGCTGPSSATAAFFRRKRPARVNRPGWVAVRHLPLGGAARSRVQIGGDRIGRRTSRGAPGTGRRRKARISAPGRRRPGNSARFAAVTIGSGGVPAPGISQGPASLGDRFSRHILDLRKYRPRPVAHRALQRGFRSADRPATGAPPSIEIMNPVPSWARGAGGDNAGGGDQRRAGTG